MCKQIYPWDSLANVGDTFTVDELSEKVRRCAISAARTRKWKIIVKKIKGGSLVERVA